MNSDLRGLAEAAIQANARFLISETQGDYYAARTANIAFADSSDPAVILGLLDQIDALEKELAALRKPVIMIGGFDG